jgi:hypothetical protein
MFHYGLPVEKQWGQSVFILDSAAWITRKDVVPAARVFSLDVELKSWGILGVPFVRTQPQLAEASRGVCDKNYPVLAIGARAPGTLFFYVRVL